MWVIILQSDQQNYSKMLYETIAVSLLARRLPMPALLVAHSTGTRRSLSQLC